MSNIIYKSLYKKAKYDVNRGKNPVNKKLQWVKFCVVLAIYLLFLVWVESWLGLIVVPFIYDVYISKKIRWQWWKDSEGPVRFLMSWVDALVFALVFVAAVAAAAAVSSS